MARTSDVLSITGSELAVETTIEVNKDDLSRAIHSVDSLRDIDFDDMLETIKEFIQDRVIPRIFDEGDQRVWKRLSPVTLEWRRTHGYQPGPILRASGDLYDAATTDLHFDIGGIVGEKSELRMWVEGIPYANVHQRGTERTSIGSIFARSFKGASSRGKVKKVGTGVIPARPFFPQSYDDFTAAEKDQISAIMERYIERLIAAREEVGERAITTIAEAFSVAFTERHPEGYRYYNFRDALGRFATLLS